MNRSDQQQQLDQQSSNIKLLAGNRHKSVASTKPSTTLHHRNTPLHYIALPRLLHLRRPPHRRHRQRPRTASRRAAGAQRPHARAGNAQARARARSPPPAHHRSIRHLSAALRPGYSPVATGRHHNFTHLLIALPQQQQQQHQQQACPPPPPRAPGPIRPGRRRQARSPATRHTAQHGHAQQTGTPIRLTPPLGPPPPSVRSHRRRRASINFTFHQLDHAWPSAGSAAYGLNQCIEQVVGVGLGDVDGWSWLLMGGWNG